MRLSRNGERVTDWRPEFIENRLYTVAAFVYSLLGDDVQDIESVDDHKGDLTVRWKRRPSAFAVYAFGAAWDSVSESASNITHEWPGDCGLANFWNHEREAGR